jgi:prophage regulatory protein
MFKKVQPMKYPVLIRKPDVLKKVPISSTTLYDRIKNGLFPPSIQLGGHSVAWLEEEVDSVIAALIRGQSTSDIKNLVSQLVAKRDGGL